MLRLAILVICICVGLKLVAQESDSTAWKPTWGIDYTTELQVTQKGKFNFANYLRLSANLPISSTLSFEVATLSTYMTSKESIGEDLQIFSNLDATNVPFSLAVCGLNWEINDRHTLFAGIRNIDEDYFITPVTSLFVNSSCGGYPTIYSNYPVGTYPLASLGIHYEYNYKNWTVKASLYNGEGYYRFTGRENLFRFCPKGDGLFGIAQLEYSPNGSNYIFGISSHYGGKFYTSDKRWGTTIWSYAEQRITNRLSLLVGYTHAFGKNLACRDLVGVGGRYLWRRCEFGLFTDYARFGKIGESATELTCKIQVHKYIYVQPSLHAMVTDGSFNSAMTLRFGFSL